MRDFNETIAAMLAVTPKTERALHQRLGRMRSPPWTPREAQGRRWEQAADIINDRFPGDIDLPNWESAFMRIWMGEAL